MSTALVSGGKDSIFSAAIADAQGWPVDELLVARPSEPDSMMFHTPNLWLVGLQARAWGKRLREAAVEGVGEAAEVASLASALRGSRGAVVAGAIASSYQWARLARVTHDLGRPLFTPLWGKAPEVVVAAEIAAGLDIRIVQVAAEPLGPSYLGRQLDTALLEELGRVSRERRAVHVAGEGGEFETLVVDAPFFEERIETERTERTVTHSTARLRVTRARLVPKEGRRSSPKAP
jgi:diphthine-ammonia ligase